MPKAKQTTALKSAAPSVFTADASLLAAGLNLGTVLSIQNHWREYYNPLPGLDLPRARALYDMSRMGFNAELQNVYREMEGSFPTLIGLIERRTSPLLEMDFDWKPYEEDKLPDGATTAMAESQAESLSGAYAQIDNLYEAVEWLELGAFRGYAHLEKIYANPGTSDLSIEHLEPIEQWHWTRKSMYSTWEYVAAATQTNSGVPINYEQFIINEVKRPIDRFALTLWIRNSLCEKDWDAFIEIYGIQSWIIVMPPNVPKEKESIYLQSARQIAAGAGGALPFGSDAKGAASSTKDGKDTFRPRLDWLQEQLCLAGTGGMLTMLAMPTGMNDSQGEQHADAFNQLSKKEARRLNKECFQRQLDKQILAWKHPGEPICAATELCAQEETDVAAFVDAVYKLSQSGYQVAPAQITAKTGYEVTIKPAAAPSALGADDDDPEDDTLTNRLLNRGGLDPHTQAVVDAALPDFIRNRQADFKPLIDRLHGIVELDNPVLAENALRKLKTDLNDPKSDIFNAALTDPKSAASLANAMTAGFFNGVAAAEAQHPIKNRK